MTRSSFFFSLENFVRMRKKSKSGKKALAASKAKTRATPNSQPNEPIDTNDFEFQDEDLDILNEYGDSLRFLTGFTPKDLEKYELTFFLILCRNPEKLKVPARVELSLDDAGEEDELVEVTENNDRESDTESSSSLSQDSEDDEYHREAKKAVDADVDYEARISTLDSDKWIRQEPISRLPIKSDSGKIIPVNTPLVVDRVEDDKFAYQEEKRSRLAKKDPNQRNREIPTKNVTADADISEETMASSDNATGALKSFSDKRERMAEIAMLITSNPEKHVFSPYHY